MSLTPVVKSTLYLDNRGALSRHHRRRFLAALQEVRDSGIDHKFCEGCLDYAFEWEITPQGYNFWCDFEELISAGTR